MALISKEMIELLNKQMNDEYLSANIYFNMGSWCINQGLKGCGRFLIRHASIDEYKHMEKLFNYINDAGGQATIKALKEPESSYKSVKEVFEKTLEHEKSITASINKIVEYAIDIKDHTTFHFLEWYVKEQFEEEKLFTDIIEKINIIGGELKSNLLYLFDREIVSLDLEAHGN